MVGSEMILSYKNIGEKDVPRVVRITVRSCKNEHRHYITVQMRVKSFFEFLKIV